LTPFSIAMIWFNFVVMPQTELGAGCASSE
jgi:hypothetical protein